MKWLSNALKKAPVLFLPAMLLLLPPPVCSREIEEKTYRDYFGKLGLTSIDEENLRFLDDILVRGSAKTEEVLHVVRILENSDSKDVVCHALTVLSNLHTTPDFVIDEFNYLAKRKNLFLRDHLALVLGKLAIPKTFQAFLKLLERPFLSNLAVVVLPRFGIESLAALPLVFPYFQCLEHRPSIVSVHLCNYFSRLPQFCISLSCIGIGVAFSISTKEVPEDTFSALAPKPVLPRIKEVLKALGKMPIGLTQILPGRKYKNFDLPDGRQEVICQNLIFSKVPLGDVISSLFALLKVQVRFKDSIEDDGFSCEVKNRPAGQMLDEIFSRFGLKGILHGEEIVIERRR